MRKQSQHQESSLVLEMRKSVPLPQHCREAGTRGQLTWRGKRMLVLKKLRVWGLGRWRGGQGWWLLQETEL